LAEGGRQEDNRVEVERRIADLRQRPGGGGGGVSPIGPAVMAAGGAMLVASAITGIVGLAQDASLTAMCPDNRCPESARGLAEEVENLMWATDVLFFAGLATAAVGLALIFALPAETPPPASAACTSDGCGIVLWGSF
jgi:hypothetical protein